MSDELTQRIQHLEAQVNLLTQLAGGTSSATEAAPDLSAALSNAVHALEPLRPLFADDSVNDILINDAKNVFVERAGRMERVSLTFPDDAAIFEIASAIAAQAGRTISQGRPLVDARLADGSRVNIIAPPLSVDGTSISIRKFSRFPITLDIMAQQGNMSAQLAEFLKVCARCRLNIVIAGGTGSGKTTLLNALGQHIDHDERIVTIEDAAELRLNHPNLVRLETKPGLGHKENEVTIRDLVRNALRMRPDRIIVGEVRGAEAFDMMQAMNTGHEGSLTTIHANHPRDALARLENMITMVNLNLPNNAIRAQVASAVHLIVQTSRMRDGKRRITYISEVVGMESEVITMQDLFMFQNKGEDEKGDLLGDFKWSGIMPRFLRRVGYYGEAERMSNALGVKLPKL
jgi:pilus assembly protein CpaF